MCRAAAELPMSILLLCVVCSHWVFMSDGLQLYRLAPKNSIWPHLSYDLVRRKRDCQNCSLVVVLCSFLYSCPIIWAAHRFCLPDFASSCWVYSLCLDYFVCVRLFSCIISACMLYYCNTVRWACWDWELLYGWLTTLLQSFGTVGWVRPVKMSLECPIPCRVGCQTLVNRKNWPILLSVCNVLAWKCQSVTENGALCGVTVWCDGALGYRGWPVVRELKCGQENATEKMPGCWESSGVSGKTIKC